MALKVELPQVLTGSYVSKRHADAPAYLHKSLQAVAKAQLGVVWALFDLPAGALKAAELADHQNRLNAVQRERDGAVAVAVSAANAVAADAERALAALKKDKSAPKPALVVLQDVEQDGRRYAADLHKKAEVAVAAFAQQVAAAEVLARKAARSAAPAPGLVSEAVLAKALKLLRSKTVPLLRGLPSRRADLPPPAFMAGIGPVSGAVMLNKAVGGTEKNVLSKLMGGQKGIKYFRGVAIWEAKAVTFVSLCTAIGKRLAASANEKALQALKRIDVQRKAAVVRPPVAAAAALAQLLEAAKALGSQLGGAGEAGTGVGDRLTAGAAAAGAPAAGPDGSGTIDLAPVNITSTTTTTTPAATTAPSSGDPAFDTQRAQVQKLLDALNSAATGLHVADEVTTIEAHLKVADAGVFAPDEVADASAAQAHVCAAFNRAYGPGTDGAALAGDMLPRAVFGWPALTEKLLCADDGIEDAVLELCKVAALRRAGRVDLRRDREWRLVGRQGDQLALGWLDAASEDLSDSIEVPQALAREIAATPQPWAALRACVAGDAWVDHRRALI